MDFGSLSQQLHRYGQGLGSYGIKMIPRKHEKGMANSLYATLCQP